MEEETNDSQVEILKNIKHTELDIRIVLMSNTYSIGQVTNLAPGAILMFDTHHTTPPKVFVNERQLANADVVQVDEHYGVRIKEFTPAPEN